MDDVVTPTAVITMSRRRPSPHGVVVVLQFRRAKRSPNWKTESSYRATSW